jgi:hypothetical protein
MLQATSLVAAAAALSSVSRNGSVQPPANVLGQDGGSALAVIESMGGSSSLVVQGALASLISAILYAAPLPEDALDRLNRLSLDTVLPAIFSEIDQVMRVGNVTNKLTQLLNLQPQNAFTMHTSDIEGYRCVPDPSNCPKPCRLFILKT